MKKLFVIGLIMFIGFFPIYAGADLIDFESGGYAEGNSVGTIITATNQVSFYQSKRSTGGIFKSKIAEVGGTTQYAFKSKIGSTIYYDTPSGGNPGSYFLTDTNIQANAENYFIQFSSPVADISLDLYDFDNGTGSAVLTAYSGAIWTGSVGTYTVSSPPGDGSVVNLFITDPTSDILSVSLTWINGSIDDETGIDNISFNTVPIPGALWLLGSGLMGMVAMRRRKGKE